MSKNYERCAHGFSFSAKGCFIKHFNEKLDELSLSLKADCSDGSSDTMWSYTALNYGELGSIYIVVN